ncbi:MAG TPA: DMT family transporter [Geminicoccus sp.]|uniref:DMT family transporter n=1 Tax=Geminicoccus sp. TaxID=2024832 RepID=UPI002E36DDC4|nr:DMT family transporter [Geminicoccus sp.]HEX2527668.1 DMT family transporter [Geminicoccus sp.]
MLRRSITLSAPALFVFLWSTGFIGMKFAAPYAEPLTFLAWRFAIVAAIMTSVALLTRAPWPRSRRQFLHAAVAGILLQAVYLGGVYESLVHGLSTGTSSLIASMQPVLVAAIAGPLLGERLVRRQWLGIGFGVVGVLLVVGGSLRVGSAQGTLEALAGLLGITAGTLWQKRFCADLDLRTGSAVQFGAAALVCLLGAGMFEEGRMGWNGQVVFAMAWLVLVLSLGAISLLFTMIREGQVARVSALFFLVPPVTALLGWLLFGEQLGWGDLAGMALSAVGVALVSRRPPPPALASPGAPARWS